MTPESFLQHRKKQQKTPWPVDCGRVWLLKGVRRGLLNTAFQKDTGRVMVQTMGASCSPSPAGPEREEMSVSRRILVRTGKRPSGLGVGLEVGGGRLRSGEQEVWSGDPHSVTWGVPGGRARLITAAPKGPSSFGSPKTLG